EGGEASEGGEESEGGEASEGLVDFTVDPDASEDSFTISDGVENSDTPVVSFSADQSEITPGEEVTINFSVEGEIPDGGLEVAVDSESIRALSNILEFDENDIPEITSTEGIFFDDIEDIEGDVDDSGFFATLTENEASLTLPLSPTSAEFGEISFSLLDGENYGVDSTADSADLVFAFGGDGNPDLDGDGEVNEDDLGILGAALGSSFFDDDDNYDPQADLTGDGNVNLDDLGAFAANFGEVV
ncbi:MAG: hypothetical protein ACLFM2_07560, partial [Halothece sp.]